MRRPRLDGVKIKTPRQIEAMKRAGRLSAQALQAAGSLVEPGISTAELDACAERVIREGGGIPAFKGYDGFPGSICASVNDTVVHGIPDASSILQDGDIVSIDTGAIVDGWVGDNAATFVVGNVAPLVQSLLDACEKAMWEGIDQARAGNFLGDVGCAIQSTIEGAGFGVVKRLAGHGVGRKMHEAPVVLNHGKARTGKRIEPGMVLAIEPMATLGSSDLLMLADGWTVKTLDGKPVAHFERTVAITDDGPLVLTDASLKNKH